MSETHSGPAGTVAKTLVQRHEFRYYDLLVHVFVVVLLVSNLVAQKLCAIGPFTIGGVEFGPFLISGAQILFPITYIFGDIFVEVYGYSASRRAIWIGFFPLPCWRSWHRSRRACRRRRSFKTKRLSSKSSGSCRAYWRPA